MSSEKLAIAIDIGTTYCTVGIYKNGAVEIIANEQGNRTTPAYVAFTAKETLVGESALAQAHLNTSNTIYDAKRLLGKQFSDPSIADDLKHFPFKVTADEHDRPLIHVEVKGQAITKTPQDITGILIQTMKATAEGYLGREFPQGVLTVPASFDQKQRDATIAAAKLAGFTSVILINEPTAAAMAHGLDVKTETPQHILVFDLGGGTLDVTLLHVQDGLFTVKAEVVNPRLGGENFDDKIMQHFIADFKRKHKVDLSTSERAMRRLHNAAEKCKVVLSTASQTNMELDSIMDGNSIFEPLSRARFELLCAEYFRALPVHIQQVLTQGGIEKSDVNHILLVGGSSRIPKVSDVVKQFFNGKAPLQKGINPDEAIAYGATRQAALIANRPKGLEDKSISRDATSLTIGFLSPSGIITPLIAKSTPLPTSVTHVFTNSKTDDSKLVLALYEGERPSPADCHLLAHLTIDGVKSPAQVSVTVNIAKDGTLAVTAKDKSQKKEHQVTVSDSASRFSASEVSSHLASVSTHAAADAALRAAAQAADQLAAFIHYVTTQTSTDKKIKAAGKERITSSIKDIQTWLDKVNNATTSTSTSTSRPPLSEYESRFNQLHTLVTSIIESASTSSPIPSSSSPATNGIHYGDPDDIPIEHLDMNGDEDGANVEIADLD